MFTLRVHGITTSTLTFAQVVTTKGMNGHVASCKHIPGAVLLMSTMSP